MDHRGTVGRIYKEEHHILLQTKYESSGPSGLGEEDFIHPAYHAPYTLLLTKYESSRPCGFGEEDFYMFFPL